MRGHECLRKPSLQKCFTSYILINIWVSPLWNVFWEDKPTVVNFDLLMRVVDNSNNGCPRPSGVNINHHPQIWEAVGETRPLMSPYFHSHQPLLWPRLAVMPHHVDSQTTNSSSGRSLITDDERMVLLASFLQPSGCLCCSLRLRCVCVRVNKQMCVYGCVHVLKCHKANLYANLACG